LFSPQQFKESFHSTEFWHIFGKNGGKTILAMNKEKLQSLARDLRKTLQAPQQSEVFFDVYEVKESVL